MNLRSAFHSLFFRISLSFVMLFIFTTTVFGILMYEEYESQIRQKGRMIFPFMHSAYESFTLNRNVPTFLERMEGFDIHILEDDETIKEIRQEGRWLRSPNVPHIKYEDDEDEDEHLRIRRSKKPPATLIRHHGDLYIHFRNRLLQPYLFKVGEKPELGYLWLSYGITLLLIGLLYLGIIRSLRPLKQLREEIGKFAKGNMNIQCHSDKKDEIATVANEFQHAVDTIRQLTESRRLFLRNIMHELKTPIHKGKLALAMLEKNKYTSNISKSLERQEHLIQEFTRIEQLSADQLKPEIQPCRLIDILEQALDLLPEKPEMELPDCDIKIQADFDLLSTALKNLIDNAIKYSPNHQVILTCLKNTLIIQNEGKPLEFELQSYHDPYLLAGKKQQESRGLGFGLYITLQILHLHGFEISYAYYSGVNRFEVSF